MRRLRYKTGVVMVPPIQKGKALSFDYSKGEIPCKYGKILTLTLGYDTLKPIINIFIGQMKKNSDGVKAIG